MPKASRAPIAGRPRYYNPTRDYSPTVNVHFGSLADICSAKVHVRFAPNSGRPQRMSAKGTLVNLH